jgi:hypothetical protein
MLPLTSDMNFGSTLWSKRTGRVSLEAGKAGQTLSLLCGKTVSFLNKFFFIRFIKNFHTILNMKMSNPIVYLFYP